MRKEAWWSCCWPGLRQLWYRGAWSGLALAAVSALLLDLTLLASFVWTDVLSSQLRWSAWVLVASVWVVSAVSAMRTRQELQPNAHFAQGDLFPEAIGEYLKGNWIDAEALLTRLIVQHPEDVDARLWLATLWRHTGRLGEAKSALNELVRLPGSEKWGLEVRRELDHLTQETPGAEPPVPADRPQARAA